MKIILLSLIMIFSTTNAYAAWDWIKKPFNRNNTMEINTDSACVREILIAQKKYGIPDNLLLAIGLQETGIKGKDGVMTVWPYSVNAKGVGKWFNTKAEAIDWANKKYSSGIKSIDIGCMQINQKWHPKAFINIEEGFDERKNVTYAAELLVSLKKKTGSWKKGAATFHSATPKHRNKYAKLLSKKIKYANKHFNYYTNLAGEKKLAKNIKTKIVRNASIWSSEISGRVSNSLYQKSVN